MRMCDRCGSGDSSVSSRTVGVDAASVLAYYYPSGRPETYQNADLCGKCAKEIAKGCLALLKPSEPPPPGVVRQMRDEIDELREKVAGHGTTLWPRRSMLTWIGSNLFGAAIVAMAVVGTLFMLLVVLLASGVVKP
jgi:hypothetical protein